MNRVGKYAASAEVDGIQLLKMVFELPEKDKMLMWSEGYIDVVIERLPDYARDILEKRKMKWENTKAYVQDKLEEIIHQQEFIEKVKGGRKTFALFVMENFREFQSLLFLIYDRNLKDEDLRKFVYRRRVGKKRITANSIF
jgi:hypothetical protein